jgi:ribosomal protein L12E/L44/L45/RPP1/RPP2
MKHIIFVAGLALVVAAPAHAADAPAKAPEKKVEKKKPAKKAVKKEEKKIDTKNNKYGVK